MTVFELAETYAIPGGELRRVNAELCPVIFSSLESERERLQAHMPWTTKIHTQKDLCSLMVEDRAGDTRFDYAIFNGTWGFCGCLGAIDLVRAHRQCRLQYWLRKDAEGRGLLGEALAVFECALFSAGIHRIEVLCQEVNPRSVRFAEKNGYEKEGVMRDAVFHLGEFRNVVVLGKVKE